ncbi:hypothetical protein CYY_009085 [Polysphondylium violaceum]|uniref:Uncharacterized protein n=1 Tax=Polysphondylium violaceum TaxID=133409 RepID=A0A8J4PM49_9MYCE|nr:hypothetical protein CYY_009085 [Polysphondylium violaceum]
MEQENDNLDIDVGDLFLNKSYTKKPIEYFGVDILVNVLNSASTDFDLTGQVIWPAAQVLTQYIISNQHEYRDKNILEVGSGVGVCGLFLARLGQPCTLSDNNETVMELLRMNVQESIDRGYPCKEVTLDWGVEKDINNCLSSDPNGYDYIIGSDVVYWQTSIVPLFETVDKLLHKSSTSRFIICYQSRSTQTDNYLLKKAQEYGFSFEFIPIESFLNRDYLTFTDSTISIINLIIFKRNE